MSDAVSHAHFGVVDMAADHAIQAAPASAVSKRSIALTAPLTCCFSQADSDQEG